MITSPDLQNAIEDVLAGRAVRTPKTDVVGCLFEAWDRVPAGREVTWSRDIAPIVYANCLSCHREGQAAPFALRSYEDVAKRAELIASVVEDRYMPPWKPVAGFGEFHGERRLSADEIALFRAFADANAPQGNPDDAPKPPEFPGGWALGEPDLILEMPQPFDIPAGGRDIYRAFVIPIDIPPGKRDHVVEASFTTPLDAKLFGVMPHMHLLGREMKVDATPDDGKTIPLIHIDDWDFRWQDQYRFREPVRIPRGSTVRMRAVFDNSTDNPSNPSNPPKRVRWGEQTTDEMAICFLNVLVPAELDLLQLRQRLRRLR